MTAEHRNATLVIVNDDVPLLTLMQEILREEGYRVVACPTARGAHPLIKDTMPDLAILDVRMRGAPHFQTLGLMRADPRTAAIPVLVCSGSAAELRGREAWLRDQGYELLRMPFHLDDLLGRVERLLGGAGGAAGLE